MQKIIRINSRNRRSLFKKELVQKQRDDKQADRDYWEYKHFVSRDIGGRIRDEKKRRREDWLKGPLAPDRDTGLSRGTIGSFDGNYVNTWSRPEATRPDKNKAVKIGNRGNIVEDDRVVVIKGPHKGRIGNVIATDDKKGSVTVQGINLVSSSQDENNPR